MRWSWFFIFFIFLGAMALAITRWLEGSYTPGLDEQARRIGSVSLVDERGQATSFESLRDRTVVVLFGYASCPDVCPTSLAYLRGELAQLGGERHLIQPVFVSVDPDRDTPERLGQYVRHFGQEFRGWTGTQAALKDLAQGFGAFFKVDPKDAATGAYAVSHSSAFFVMDQKGRVVASLSPPHEKGALAALLTKAIHKS
jgi:protein SCO1/2